MQMFIITVRRENVYICLLYTSVYGTSSIGNPGDDSTDFKQELRRCVLLCIDFIAVDCSELSPSRVKD